MSSRANFVMSALRKGWKRWQSVNSVDRCRTQQSHNIEGGPPVACPNRWEPSPTPRGWLSVPH
jgi:hypothetical protein